MTFALIVSGFSAAWLAGAFAGLVALLPVASVARLLPSRWARLEACLWLVVPTCQVGAVLAVVAKLPAWTAHPIAYTPHIERPLPHVCFLHVLDWLAAPDLFRAASTVSAWLAAIGAVRLINSLFTSRLDARDGLSLCVPLPNPFYERVVVTPLVASPMTVGVLSPVVMLDSETAAQSAETVGAILAHEASHAVWRDPLVGALLYALAWTWPLPTALVLHMWRQASERAANLKALQRVGRLPEGVAIDDGTDDPAQTNARRPNSPWPALSAAIAWLLLLVAAGQLWWRPAVLSVVCAFEAFMRAWAGA